MNDIYIDFKTISKWIELKTISKWIELKTNSNGIESELKWIQIELKFELNRNEFWNEFIKKNSILLWIEMEVETGFETILKLFI